MRKLLPFGGALLGAIILTSCSTTDPEVYVKSNDEATVKLAEAADSVSDSLIELKRIQAQATPAVQDKNLTGSEDYGLRQHASLDWVGPIGPIVEKIAAAADYRMRILGNPPAIPVLVNVNKENESLGSILRNIDYQAGNRADISVHSDQQIIELRYEHA